MTLPDAVRERIEKDLGAIDRVHTVSGGSISPTFRVVAGGQPYFLKYATNSPPGFLAVEAAGLDQLREAASSLKVPRVAGLGAFENTEWLVLEWLEPGGGRHFTVQLGRGLATLHQRRASRCGWDRDGFIGSLPQSNRRRDSWIDFWWEERILPQLRLAGGSFTGKAWHEQLPAALERILGPVETERPSLLHGDLWSGNVMATADGPAIFDPACFYGHREVDLAMTELFGGFDKEFYAAYDEVWPRPPGYADRRAAYQLYYLLVHVNIFGGSYAGRATDALRHLLAASSPW